MAKRSKIARNEQRAAVVARYAERRAELKRVVASPSSSFEEKADAERELQRQPRAARARRAPNRLGVVGRPRGYLRKFGLSRVRLRQQAHRGELPGVTKSSW